jgi:6,7-dimethyl-8-ribityllumazine synthase
MPRVIDTPLLAQNSDRFAIVVSRFNDLITGRLMEGAVSTLTRHGADEQKITVAWVPGSYELPLASEKLAASGEYEAVIALGAVIQGETTHHDYINHAMAQGLMQASQRTGVPILFGVLTCENLDQALNRAGGKVGNKGTEAALAAIEMVNLLRKLG